MNLWEINSVKHYKGESYITKGETDIKKIFLVVWIFIMTILLSITFIIIA